MSRFNTVPHLGAGSSLTTYLHFGAEQVGCFHAFTLLTHVLAPGRLDVWTLTLFGYLGRIEPTPAHGAEQTDAAPALEV
ncbi:MAG: hypothetical protein JWN86_2183 [Planctomycetota bacterium]|nr:hypothetical protein [Planctomycetota bacterium]